MFGGSCRVPKTRPSVAEESFTESEETTDEEGKLDENEEDEKLVVLLIYEVTVLFEGFIIIN